MKRALVIGGSNGIGLSIALNLPKYEHIYIVDKVEPEIKLTDNMSFKQFDLTSTDYSIFNEYSDIDTLIITAGFGKLELFESINDKNIIDSFFVNTIAPIRIIKHFYQHLNSVNDFYCTILVSIAGLLSSPFYSIYGASKAALCKFIESVNVELEMAGSKNRILNVSPGSIKGTKFNNGSNDIKLTTPLANSILKNMYNKNDLFIPKYDEVYKSVLDRYISDFRKFGRESYNYKVQNRINSKDEK